MVVTGELIRMMNYVDDVAATLRRIQVGIQAMSTDEKRRLAEYIRSSQPSYIKLLEIMEKA
jgi:hypothetical protein